METNLCALPQKFCTNTERQTVSPRSSTLPSEKRLDKHLLRRQHKLEHSSYLRVYKH